ncbi:preprotein translocase subunit SecG [Mesobaculum littorinae]|uniref:Protein-export membrane protein SecG n=1 Tax=Mesobaculum littorinae TaxID=2486419 RepID=A0A438AJ25_9RHOB|nr:preprotein translocase subunit SecG [Mesobaculum littorinae]RVV98692.1 preprotein translocase subunit SecG [Mesobaculum littorinae]
MENVVLIVHLILALCLIGVVLLQRSEGGGLGMGGGGGGGVMSSRGAATALNKMTWGLAIAFILTSLGLTIIAAQSSSTGSVLDRVGTSAPAVEEEAIGDAPGLGGGDLLPPPADGDAAPDAPITPRAD